MCQPCRDNNGGACECDLSGNCKCLMHDAAKAADVRGDPRSFLDADLFEFADLVRRAIYISPWDLRGAPTLQAVAWMDIETPYDMRTTQILAGMLLAEMFPKK